jgi:hypothetical protein
MTKTPKRPRGTNQLAKLMTGEVEDKSEDSLMLIHNYGLFWRRNDVYWGKPGDLGHLQGHPARSAFAIVDFRDQQGVYCLYDDNFHLVYVGQAGAND